MKTTRIKSRPKAKAVSLRTTAMDALAERYTAAEDDAEAAAILAEMDRRERTAARTAIDAARWAAVYEDWTLFAHAQYLAAEEECRGNLVAREYLAEITTGWQLWTGSHRWAMERATEELRDFWAVNPRITVTEFREMQRAANREEREQQEAGE
jgi:hypothetical protein